MPEQEQGAPFVSYLLTLVGRKDSKAKDLVMRLNIVARSQHLDKIWQDPAVLKAIGMWHHEETPYWAWAAQNVLTPLVVLHPQQEQGQGNMGDHLRLLAQDWTQVDQVFERLVRVPASELALLYQSLWIAVSQLKFAEIAVNWYQLYRDVQQWLHPQYRKSVIRRWTRSYVYKPQQEQKE